MGARLKFSRRSRVPKKESRDEEGEIFLAAPPSNLTRLHYNGSAAKSHSTTTQYRQLCRLSGLKSIFHRFRNRLSMRLVLVSDSFIPKGPWELL